MSRQPFVDFPFKVHDPKTGDLLKAFRTNDEAHAFRRELVAPAAPVSDEKGGAASKSDK